MISQQDFAAKIKQKYPQYAGLDDATLTQKVVEKYPQYKTQVLTTPTMTGNVLSKVANPNATYSGRLNTFTEDTAGRIKESADRYASGKQSFASAAFQTGGNLIRGAFNPIMAAISPAVEKVSSRIPTPTEQKLRDNSVLNKVVGKVSDNPALQQFAQTEPAATLERNVEAAVDYTGLLPTGKATQAANIAKSSKSLVSDVSATASKVQQSRVSNAVNNIATTYRTIAEGTIPTNKKLLRSEARGKDPIAFLSERGITPSVEDGTIRSTKVAANLREQATPIYATLDKALKEIQPSVELRPIESVRQAALQRVDDLPQTETVREAIRNDINKEFDLLKARYGERLQLTTENNIKQTNWTATPFDMTKPYQGDVNYIIARAFKDDIEAAIPKGSFDISELNNHLGDIHDAAKFLDTLEGRKVKGGRLGNYFARGTGAIIGSNAGPLGSIAGMIGGDMVSNILQSNTFSAAAKRRILANIQKENPQAYQQVLEYLERAGLEKDLRPLLPAPDPTRSTINQGRPIPVLPKGPQSDFIGADTAIGAPTTRPNRTPLPTQSIPEQTRQSNPLPQSKPQSGNSAMFGGAVATGAQPDEEGGISFNPLGGALGAAGGFALSAKGPTAALKNAQTYAKEAKSLLNKGVDSSTLQILDDAYEVLWRAKSIPGGETKSEFMKTVRTALKPYVGETIYDWSDQKVTRLVEAVQARIKELDEKWIGTKSSKPSTAANMSTSNALTGRGDVSVPKTDMSGGFEGTTVYRGAKSPELQDGRGAWLSSDKEIAAGYGKVSEHVLPSKLNLFQKNSKTPSGEWAGEVIERKLGFLAKDTSPKMKDFPHQLWNNPEKNPQLISLLKEQGYEGYTIGKNTYLFDAKSIKPSPSIPKELEGLVAEARKYKTAEEFKRATPVVYHGSPTPLKKFSNKKGGVFFTEEYADATGFAGSPDNVYEGYLNFKKPLVIDAKGAKWDDLDTKYGQSTQQVISNAQKDGYDGIIFKNIIDNIADDAEAGNPGTIYYAYKPEDAFLNESQLTDFFNKVKGNK